MSPLIVEKFLSQVPHLMFWKWALYRYSLFASQDKMWLSIKVTWTLDDIAIVISVRMGHSFQNATSLVRFVFPVFGPLQAMVGCPVAPQLCPYDRLWEAKVSLFLAWQWIGIAFFFRIMPRWRELYHRWVIVIQLVPVKDNLLQVSCIPDKTKLEKQERVKKKKRKEQHLSGE